MKLRNKKTGEIVIKHLAIKGNNQVAKTYDSLADLNKEWEDYEEPKKTWFIDTYGSIRDREAMTLVVGWDNKPIFEFETKEEAEKALEKLKAWKRLKDKGITIRKLQHNENGGTMYWSCPSKTGISDKQIWLDLDLLFGGEYE